MDELLITRGGSKKLLPDAESGVMAGKVNKAGITPARRIEAAIQRGVPIYNQDDHAGCVAIYLACLVELADDPSLERPYDVPFRCSNSSHRL